MTERWLNDTISLFSEKRIAYDITDCQMKSNAFSNQSRCILNGHIDIY